MRSSYGESQFIRDHKLGAWTRTHGTSFFSTAEYLQSQLDALKYHVCALQETRAKSSTIEAGDYIRLVAGSPQGQGGCELWFSKNHRIGPFEACTLQHLTVLHSEPSILVVPGSLGIYTSMHSWFAYLEFHILWQYRIQVPDLFIAQHLCQICFLCQIAKKQCVESEWKSKSWLVSWLVVKQARDEVQTIDGLIFFHGNFGLGKTVINWVIHGATTTNGRSNFHGFSWGFLTLP